MKTNIQFRNSIKYAIPMMIIVSFLSVVMNQGIQVYSTLFISSGFAIGYIVVYGKKILKFLAVGMFVGYVIGLVAINETDVLTYFFYPISHIVGLSTAGLIYRDFLIKNEVFDDTSFTGVVLHTIGSIIVIIIGSLITFILLLPVQFDLGIIVFFNVLIGNMMGFLLFGVLLFMIFHYEDEIFIFKDIKIGSILFIAAYVIFVFLVYHFGGLSSSIFGFGYLFILFFFISGVLFSFRQILLFGSIYLLAYQLNIDVIRNVPGSLSTNILFMNVFLIFMSVIGIVIRAKIYENEIQTEIIKISEDRLEKTLIATQKILQVGEYSSQVTKTSAEEYMKEIFGVITQIFSKYDAASCYVKDGEHVKFIDAINYDHKELTNFKLSIYDFKWNKKKPIHVKNAKKIIESVFDRGYNAYKSLYPDLKEYLSFRVFIEEGEVGGISLDLYDSSESSYLKEDIAFIQNFQNIVNSYYEYNTLRNSNSIMKDEVVLSLIHTLELYDEYTSGHSEEVAYLSKEIGKSLGLSQDQYDELYWAGIVHDIGKVGIPNEIINKKGPLTKAEYDQVKEHSINSYNIINKSSELSKVALMIKHHHEWFNGSGYPDGMKGNQIPLGSRILTVCDAVSSMAKERSYSKASSISEIRAELLLYRESQFCPVVVAEMIKFIDSGKVEEYYKSKD